MTPNGERRKSARREPAGAVGEALVRLPLSGSVQVLDISRSGVLLSSNHPLPVGRRARLRLRLGADPVTLPVEIRRVQPDRHGTRFKLGARFVVVDDEDRLRLERFLRHEV